MNLSQALSIFSENLVDIRKACVLNARDISEQYPNAKEIDIEREFTVERIWAHFEYYQKTKKLEHIIKVIKRIDARKRAFKNKDINEEDIARAKDVSIEQLFDGHLSEGINKVGLCPFHSEKTPSFTIFKDNRFKCFGCGVFGDSIEFIIKRDNVDFIRAIKTLT